MEVTFSSLVEQELSSSDQSTWRLTIVCSRPPVCCPSNSGIRPLLVRVPLGTTALVCTRSCQSCSSTAVVVFMRLANFLPCPCTAGIALNQEDNELRSANSNGGGAVAIYSLSKNISQVNVSSSECNWLRNSVQASRNGAWQNTNGFFFRMYS